jgi:hypothetical protein
MLSRMMLAKTVRVLGIAGITLVTIDLMVCAMFVCLVLLAAGAYWELLALTAYLEPKTTLLWQCVVTLLRSTSVGAAAFARVMTSPVTQLMIVVDYLRKIIAWRERTIANFLARHGAEISR